MLKAIRAIRLPAWTMTLALLGVCLLSYGLVAFWLGFYWDDQALNWIAHAFGPAGLARYFATNRPVWGLLYQVTTRFLGAVPWHWQLFAIFWRWAAAVFLWAVLRRTWRGQPEIAVGASLLFAVYPGFTQQFVSLVFSHFFIVLSALLASFYLSLLAFETHGVRRLACIGGALMLSLFNLLCMEYFFVFELFRAALFWAYLAPKVSPGKARVWKTAVQTLRQSVPYLAGLAAAAAWRMFFFRFQTQNYQTVFFDQLKQAPLAAIGSLLMRILRDLWLTSFAAWAQVFQQVNGYRSLPTDRLTWILIALTAAGLSVFLLLYARTGTKDAPDRNWQAGLSAAAVGLVGMLLAGWPFWLTGLLPDLRFSNDRFTLPFMTGVSLLLAGLWRALPVKRWLRLVLLGVTVSLAVGWQYQMGSQYRIDWKTEKTILWQLSWRIPGIPTGTALWVNELPIQFSSDNSLSAPINWMYAPVANSTEMTTMLYYPENRLGKSLPALLPGLPLEKDYLAAAFHGSTSRMIVFLYDPPGCLRILDPEIDAVNPLVPELLRSAVLISNPGLIQTDPPGGAAHPPASWFGSEPAHNWCHSFETADLARQRKDWQAVVQIGSTALMGSDKPNDPTEYIPFIEGYAHSGDWTRAQTYTDRIRTFSPAMKPVLCSLWTRINQDTDASLAKNAAVQAELEGCSR
jgi:hypothetical protein